MLISGIFMLVSLAALKYAEKLDHTQL